MRACLLLSSGLFFLLIGCAANRINLIENGVVEIHTEQPKDLRLSASAYTENGDVVVAGYVRRMPVDHRPIWGHVDVQVIGPHKELLAQYKTGIRATTGRKRLKKGRFQLTLLDEPPVGSVIMLRHDYTAHP